MPHPPLAVLAATVLATAIPTAPALAQQSCESAGDPGAVAAIESRRVAFNRAIAAGDLDGVSAVLHPDVILITGTDSDVYRGRAAQLAIWDSDFGDPDRSVYVRTTRCVRVSPVFPVALEMGEWRGERPATSGGEPDFAAGRYAAKWRRVDGVWLLESEVFATEACGGGFCSGG
jgi:ketosteroid isomerase-like protein